MNPTAAPRQAETFAGGSIPEAPDIGRSGDRVFGAHAPQRMRPAKVAALPLSPKKFFSKARTIRSVALTGPAGRLEAVLNEGQPDAPFAALVCHPHPSYGGNLHNKVVYHAMKALNDPAWGLGWPVLRFNFRGAGLSQGVHDGEAETGDVLAALDWLEREFHLPLVVAGFSFGAAMALRACCAPGQPRYDVRAFIALGLPLQTEFRAYHYPFLSQATIPKLFLSGDRDQFAPAAELTRLVSTTAEPRRLLLLHGADHFFTDQLEPMQRTIADWLKEQPL